MTVPAWSKRKAIQHAVVYVQSDYTSRHELERQVNANARLRYIDNLSRRRKVGVF
jgi:hypothetical protein